MSLFSYHSITEIFSVLTVFSIFLIFKIFKITFNILSKAFDLQYKYHSELDPLYLAGKLN